MTSGECEELAVDSTSLKDVESGKSFGDTQTIVFFVMNYQLGCLPMIEVATGIVLGPGI